MCCDRLNVVSERVLTDTDVATLDRQALQAEVLRLRDEIRRHRDERGHNRCWLDDQRLYQSLPEKCNGDLQLPARSPFLANCERYWRTRNTNLTASRDPLAAHEPRDYGPELGMVHLREPRPSDLAAVVDLDRTLWDAWATPAPLYRQLFDLTPDTIILAKNTADELLGAAVGLIGSSIADGWLLSIDINPRFQRHGLGRALIEELMLRFRHLGTQHVYAVVDPNNTPSRRMLEGLGFAEHSVEANYFAHNTPQIKYRLAL